jgi:hypothetical protein
VKTEDRRVEGTKKEDEGGCERCEERRENEETGKKFNCGKDNRIRVKRMEGDRQ